MDVPSIVCVTCLFPLAGGQSIWVQKRRFGRMLLRFATFDCFAVSGEGCREGLDAVGCLCPMVVWAGVGVEAWFLCDRASGMGGLDFPREYHIVV